VSPPERLRRPWATGSRNGPGPSRHRSPWDCSRWPAALLVTAGVLTIDSWRDTAATLAAHWRRVLLGVLGGCQLLMSAGAAPAPMVAGAIGGAVLVAAASLQRAARWQTLALVVIGTVPFAALAWTSIVPLLLTVEALAIAAAIPAQRPTA